MKQTPRCCRTFAVIHITDLLYARRYAMGRRDEASERSWSIDVSLQIARKFGNSLTRARSILSNSKERMNRRQALNFSGCAPHVPAAIRFDSMPLDE